jgi:hypothetical protein
MLSVALLGCPPPFPVEPDGMLLPPPMPDTSTMPPGPGLVPEAPEVFIINPLNDSVVAPGVTLPLRGVLTDQDDAVESLVATWERLDGGLIETLSPDSDGVVESSVMVPPEGLEGVRLVGTDPGGLSRSATVTLVPNTAPGELELTIYPESPSANDDLLAIVVADALDPDRDSAAVAEVFQWYVDGELAGIEGSLVDSSLTRAGEAWTVTARAYDGFAMGPAAEASVDVGLAAPVVFISAPLGADGTVTCALDEEGSLNEATQVSWFWTVGEGAEIETGNELQADTVHHCDLVACRVELTLDGAVTSSGLASLMLPYGDDCEAQTTCLEKSCIETGGCSQEPVDEACDDGDPCTLDDSCAEGVCVSGAALVCEVAAQATASCVEGTCELFCDPGWLDCDELLETGCEFESLEDAPCSE